MKVPDADKVWKVVQKRSWYKQYENCIRFFSGGVFFTGRAAAGTTPTTTGSTAKDGGKEIIGNITVEKRVLTDRERALEVALKKAEAAHKPSENERFEFLGKNLTMPTIFGYDYSHNSNLKNAEKAVVGISFIDELLKHFANDTETVETLLERMSTGEKAEGKKGKDEKSLQGIFGKVTQLTKKQAEDKRSELQEFLDKIKEGLEHDLFIITDVLNPESAGFGKEDLVLRGVCFYKDGIYAEKTLENGGVKNTRNYFLHSWLLNAKDHTDQKSEVYKKCEGSFMINAVTMIADADGIRDKFVGEKFTLDDFGEDGYNRTVHLHNANAYSPNNFVFQIEKDGASAWFISEFDPNDPGFNTGKVEFPDSVGKRKIAIHWTFLKDNDGSKYADAVAKRKVSDKKLPCQFSPVEAERSMHDVNEYLKEKKERKAKIEISREKRLKEAEEIARKARWDRLLESDILTIDKNLFTDKAECSDFLEKVIKKGVKTLIVRDGLDSAKGKLSDFLGKIIKGEYGSGIKLESLSCEDFVLYEYLRQQTGIFRRTLSEEQIVFNLIPDDIKQTLTFEKREKKEDEGDEETKKRRLLFKLKQDLKTRKDVVVDSDCLNALGFKKYSRWHWIVGFPIMVMPLRWKVLKRGN